MDKLFHSAYLSVDNEISINELFGVEEVVPAKNQDINFIDSQIISFQLFQEIYPNEAALIKKELWNY